MSENCSNPHCGHPKSVHSFLAEGHLPHCTVSDEHNTPCPCLGYVRN